MTTSSIFGAADPFDLTRAWMKDAAQTEPADPDAIALASVDPTGMPNVRIVLLREIETDGFVFYTNYNSAKAQEIFSSGSAAFVLHWKTLGRQVRVRGRAEREDGDQADAYYNARPLDSRLGAWASHQSAPLVSREALIEGVEDARRKWGDAPPRPDHWGGIRVRPETFEFWADGTYRLHDREVWRRDSVQSGWTHQRLYP